MRYEDAWSFLDRLQFFKIKLGLDSMNVFLESLGHPQKSYPCIHIGGTNGKGSVGSTLTTILARADYKVGLYTSPHLSSVRERFRVNDRFISEEDFVRQAERIINILNDHQITYFEFTTALAMLWFAQQEVDLAIFEVGLGGRLDATNVVRPLVSVITNVGIDHEQYLGNTIREIAYEKAGIIKTGIPVVAGVSKPDAIEVVSATARKKKAPFYLLGRDFSGVREKNDKKKWAYRGIEASPGHPSLTLDHLSLNIRGNYQVDNAAIALVVLELIDRSFPVFEDSVRNGLTKVAWPGRLEEFWLDKPEPVHILLDGAHNPDGAAALKKSLLNDFTWSRLILVWASMSDKDVRNTLMEIAPLADTIIFTRPEQERSASPDALIQVLPDTLRKRCAGSDSVSDAIDLAIGAYRPGDMICIAGSLYLVGRARQLLRGELVDQ